MELIRHPVGEPADVDTDCIRVEELEDGRYRLTGTALCTGKDDGASVSLVDGLSFATRDRAEEAGLAWAESVGVGLLHISIGTLEKPLRLTEIDLPA